MTVRLNQNSVSLLLVVTILVADPAAVAAYSIASNGDSRTNVILDASSNGNSIQQQQRMQHAPSTSRLFLRSSGNSNSNTNNSIKRLQIHPTSPLKSSIPVPDYSSLSNVDETASTWSVKSNHFQNNWTPSAIRHKSEVRRRQRLYRELQVTSPKSVAITDDLAKVSPSALASTSIASVTTQPATATSTESSGCLSKMDIALFATYFCNMAVLTLSVVTVPAMAMEHFETPRAAAAFVAGVASMAPLGGGVGKLVNGFVCQQMGGRQASWMYLVIMSALSMTMSFTKSLAPIGLLLIGYEFLSSIQWTSICDVLDQHYRQKPQLMARGIALLSLSSTLGALAAKTVGAGLLQATDWRAVCRFGSLAALLGAAAMYMGVKNEQVSAPQHRTSERQSPFASLKSILGNKLFWMIGIGHSLGHLARGSDRLLGPFLQEAASLSSK
jgi:Major Facilitator Superfamily